MLSKGTVNSQLCHTIKIQCFHLVVFHAKLSTFISGSIKEYLPVFIYVLLLFKTLNYK